MPLHVAADPLIERTSGVGGDVADLMARVEAIRSPGFKEISQAFYRTQNAINVLTDALKEPTNVTDITVTDDQTGELIAWFGSHVVDGTRYINFLKEVWIGGDDPTSALIYTDAFGHVFVGKNGSVSVLDPFGDFAAWLGTQYDTLPVTGAVTNGATLIRLTVTGHTLATGDVVPVMDVGGVPNAKGTWTVTKVDANHIDLQLSKFDGTYTSGGTVNRLLHITGAANNGSGLIRITTAVAHTYEDADTVDVAHVGGVPNATGQWLVTVVDGTHLDLRDSTWAGGYTSGGTVQRYFAGGNFQTIAVGPSFIDYRLRAFADGTLVIRDARIILEGEDMEITIDPSPGDATTGPVAIDIHDLITDNHVLLSAVGVFLQDSSGAYVGSFVNPSLARHGALVLSSAVDPGSINLNFALGVGPQIAVELSGAQTLITSGYVDTVAYRVNGTPGVDATIGIGTSLTVNTGSAITSVDFGGMTTGSGTFVTSVVLNTDSHDFSKGIIVS